MKNSPERIREICDGLKRLLKNCESSQQVEDVWSEIRSFLESEGFHEDDAFEHATDLEAKWLEDKERTYRWLDGEDVSDG